MQLFLYAWLHVVETLLIWAHQQKVYLLCLERGQQVAMTTSTNRL